VVLGGDDEREVRIDAILGQAAAREGAEKELVENMALVDGWVGAGFVVAVVYLALSKLSKRPGTADLPPVRNAPWRVVHRMEPIPSDQRDRVR